MRPGQVSIGSRETRITVAGAFEEPFCLGHTKFRLDRGDNALSDAVLDGEDVLHFPVLAFGPDVVPRHRIDQLRTHPHPIPSFAHTALQHIAHPQRLRHKLYANGTTLVIEG